MNRPSIILRIACLLGLVSLCLAAAACGGGGGLGFIEPPDEGIVANFVGAPILASDIGLAEAGAGGGAFSGVPEFADFNVEVRVRGPFSDVLGTAFTLQVPDDVELRETPFSSAGSFLFGPPASPNGYEFNVTQDGNEIQVGATRLQGAVYADGIDLADGEEELLVTLNLRVTAATSGPFTIIPPRELTICDDVQETCDPVNDASLTWSGGTLNP